MELHELWTLKTSGQKFSWKHAFELNCIGKLFHSTLTHLSGHKPIWKHKRKKKPLKAP
jgi:hypothetical protein